LRCFRWLYTLAPVLPRWRGPAANYLAACYTQMGEYEMARTYAEEAVSENGKRGYRKFLLSSQMYLGVLMSRQGEYAQAEQLFDDALTAPATQLSLRRWVELHAANTFIMRGRQQDAEQLLHGVLEDKNAKPDLLAAARCIMGFCCYHRNDLPAALDNAKLALKIPGTPGWVRVMALSSMLLYLAEMGDVIEGKRIEAELYPLLPAEPTHLEQRALLAIARLALATNDLDRARDYADRAARLDANPNGQSSALLIQAEIFTARHNTHRAVTLCETVIRSNAIDFYKARAAALRQRLLAPATQSDIADRYQTLPTDEDLPAINVLRVQTS
jgi:tetratricopeptide (TPR) repeat protein